MHLTRAASLPPQGQVGVMVIAATLLSTEHLLDAELCWGLGCDLHRLQGNGT